MKKRELKTKFFKVAGIIACTLIVFVGSLFCFFGYFFPKKYSIYINELSKKYNVDKVLIYSIINTESGFNSNAQSSKGAMGLMQIMPTTATFIADELQVENFKVADMFVPSVNIEFGTFYLNYLFSKFDSIEAVICSYNAGETVVRTWLNDKKYSPDGVNLTDIPYKETANYLSKVKTNYKVYKKLV